MVSSRLDNLAPVRTLTEVATPDQPVKTIIDNTPEPPAPADVVASGTDFGEYELLEELGRGAMGVVYKARQKHLDRLVAIKVILTGRVATSQQVERFLAEARAAAKLQHPHCVHIYEAGEVRGNHFFAMEYIAGESLADAMQHRSLGVTEAAELISKVARAVDHLHAQGILHRDLKPSNILLDQEGQPFVTDFGLAMLWERDPDSQKRIAVAGTPNYMSPEQAIGMAGMIGPRTDVYGLGAVLFHLLTDRPPFGADSTMDTLVQVVEGAPPQPRSLRPAIPAELETICLHCLERHPDDRYPTAAALADDLDRFLRGEAVEARPGGFVSALKNWARRQPALVSRLAGFAACAIIAELNYQFAGEPPEQHQRILITLAVWSAGSAICQWWLSRERWADGARWTWAALDVILITMLLRVMGAVNSALVTGYAVAIAGAGLWFRERLVWLVTGVSVVGYVVIVVDGYLKELPMPSAHWHLVVVTLLVVLGWVVAYQVNRIRRLSRFYKREKAK